MVDRVPADVAETQLIAEDVYSKDSDQELRDRLNNTEATLNELLRILRNEDTDDGI